MTDDVIGSIEGTATFETVDIHTDPEGHYRVQGSYHGDKTTYQVPKDCLYIGGFSANLFSEGSLTLQPTDDEGWVWVEATEDALYITEEEREE